MRIDYMQLEFIHPLLREIMRFVEKKTGVEFTITSLYRIGGGGPHSTMPLRAVDLRCRSAVLGDHIEDLVNTTYLYDPGRRGKQCALYHDAGDGAHIHLQVHPATVKR